MDEADFEALAAHLSEVRPIFDRFCLAHDFVYASRQSLGRYPRIRICRPGPIERWIELWMELDEHGRRFETFRRDLPYELSGGACFLEPGVTKHGDRVQLPIICFSQRPFDQVAAVLWDEMTKCLAELERWDKAYTERHRRRIKLRYGSPSAME